MKNKVIVTISLLILIILSICALNTISRANTKFLGSDYDNFISIHIEKNNISIQVADKVINFNNIFSKLK